MNLNFFCISQLDELKKIALGFGVTFDYRLHDSWFPTGHEEQWRNLYAPCSAQRLFFPVNNFDENQNFTFC